MSDGFSSNTICNIICKEKRKLETNKSFENIVFMLYKRNSKSYTSASNPFSSTVVLRSFSVIVQWLRRHSQNQPLAFGKLTQFPKQTRPEAGKSLRAFTATNLILPARSKTKQTITYFVIDEEYSV